MATHEEHGKECDAFEVSAPRMIRTRPLCLSQCMDYVRMTDTKDNCPPLISHLIEYG